MMSVDCISDEMFEEFILQLGLSDKKEKYVRKLRSEIFEKAWREIQLRISDPVMQNVWFENFCNDLIAALETEAKKYIRV